MLAAGQGVGLHDFVYSDTDKEDLVGNTYNCFGGFWMMVLNYNTFGIVAPLNQGCGCNFQKMPTKWLRLRRDIDKMFSRAKADIRDVQCRYADEEEYGCHAFGLPGDLGCKFKHDILVEEVKKSGTDQDLNGNTGEKLKEETGKAMRPWQKRKTKSKKKHHF